jgi:hypothetical protein
MGDKVDDTKVSLHDWITQMQKTADALANFGANARRAADKGLKEGLIKQLEALGPAGALRMRQLANASETEIGRANRAFSSFERAGKSAINALTAAARRKIVINLDTSTAMSNLRVMQYQIDQLHGKTIIIRTTGGHVTYDTGGYTGAGRSMSPRASSTPARSCSPRGLVTATGRMLKARYGYLPGFANGGLVGAPQPANRGGTSTASMTSTSARSLSAECSTSTPVRSRGDAGYRPQEIDADADFAEKRANQ